MAKAVIVLDTLIFESLNNENLCKYLNDYYFIVLWTSKYCNIEKIPYNAYINGLRNGHKPYRYLRMFLRKYHTSVLCLPCIIVDLEKNYCASQFGYDMCINIKTMVEQQNLNNRPINVINTKQLFLNIYNFVQEYNIAPINGISPQRCKQSIVNKMCVLVVGSSFFSLYHNVPCREFVEFLNTCHIVVWIGSKNINEAEVINFRTTLKNNDINVNCMFFGLDHNIMSISYVRRSLAPTNLPFILIDNLCHIYDSVDTQYKTVCDFDYYFNLRAYMIDKKFYDMQRIIETIRKFLLSIRPKQHEPVITIEEQNSDDNEPVAKKTRFDDDTTQLLQNECRKKKSRTIKSRIPRRSICNSSWKN